MGNIWSKLYESVDQLKLSDKDRNFQWKILLKAVLRDFTLAWSVRGGIAFLPHLLKLNLLESIKSSFGIDAGRFGLSIALYFALFKVLEKVSEGYRKRQDDWNALIAGGLASVAFLLERESTRWILAQYSLVRATSCAWNTFQEKFPKIDPYAYYGDALIFSLCSGHVVYSFAAWPETLDPVYERLLMKATQMNPLAVGLFRSRLNTGIMDFGILSELVTKLATRGTRLDVEKLLNASGSLHCGHVHPGISCWHKILQVFYGNLKVAFPMYFSLHILPPFVFKFKKSLARLNEVLIASIKNGVQSTLFFTTFSAIFQILLCSQRNLMKNGCIEDRERGFFFWFAGFIAASSIFIEQKRRRAELALYILPRACVSFYRVLVKKGLVHNIKHGEMIMMAISMATIMKSYRKNHALLNPLVTRILGQFV